MKFKIGDRFRVVKELAGLERAGSIVGISFNSIYQRDEYIVRWDHLPFDHTYSPDECDPIWERIHPYIQFDFDNGKVPEQIMCDIHGHDWKVYDSGFTRFEYCSRCEKERV